MNLPLASQPLRRPITFTMSAMSAKLSSASPYWLIRFWHTHASTASSSFLRFSDGLIVLHDTDFLRQDHARPIDLLAENTRSNPVYGIVIQQNVYHYMAAIFHFMR